MICVILLSNIGEFNSWLFDLRGFGSRMTITVLVSECKKRGSSTPDWRLIVLYLGYYVDVIFKDA